MFEDPFFIKRWSYVLSNHPSKRVEQPPGAIKRVLGSYFGPVDQFVATPLANANVLENIFGYNLFTAINNSRYAAVWHGALAGVGLLALLIGHIALVYRTLRNDEKKSHFFYLRRLLQIDPVDPNLEIKKMMGEDGIDYKILIAAAYFYSPDISWLVCWKRRFFCWGKRRKEYDLLMNYLTKEGLERRKTKKEILNSIFIQTIDELVKYLNKKTAAPDLPKKFQRKDGTYLIGFSKEYSKIFFSEEIDPPKNFKKNVSLTQSILDAIEEASFFYWLCMFAFYFAPTVGMVAGLSFPPLALAFLFLTIRCVYVTYAFKKDSINKQIGMLNNTEVDYLEKVALKRKYESDDIELEKQNIFVREQLAMGRVELKSFKNSKLRKDLLNVLGNRRFMKVAAIVEAFVGGCFLPFFGIWLFSDLFKVVAGLAIGGAVTGPTAPAIFGVIFMVIATATLLWGLCYGAKKAIAAGKAQDEKYEQLEKEVNKLDTFSVEKTIKVLDLSLHDYDRFFRRYSLKQPAWTWVKKLLNRSWVVISRLGTGSLVFRLVIWGSITSFVRVPVVWIAPISVPFIAVFAVAFAVWYSHVYNVEKKWKKAENITNHFYLSRMVAVKEMAHKKVSLGKKEELCTDSFLVPQSLPSSKSEECLNAQNMDNMGLIKLHSNDSGNTSPDRAKAKISFNSPREAAGGEASDSRPLNLNYLPIRGRASSFTEGFGSRKGKNDLSSSPDLNPQGMVCHRS
ncbi:ABC transporter ATP-binding component [Candidatus Rickettsiella viridis]|uniref:ABC transporter ATP-binding component n=1 Tax=Candidatus Rickettsiella viridis TaxID=676208 RepID=A0A2Z5UT30_9COXI|nr:hypothetical protein [Candidatus Rickettsiella viridis]BBB14746.1 ABC transporter ATP-binding component [Candidatus Rickettsiella viridis]